MSVIFNISHVLIPLCCVQQHTTMMSNSKSYVCPVCGRALSSPGSLGRHLLIHSEDRLSNCAVCGARFTDTNNFNRFGSSPLSVWQDAPKVSVFVFKSRLFKMKKKGYQVCLKT